MMWNNQNEFQHCNLTNFSCHRNVHIAKCFTLRFAKMKQWEITLLPATQDTEKNTVPHWLRKGSGMHRFLKHKSIQTTEKLLLKTATFSSRFPRIFRPNNQIIFKKQNQFFFHGVAAFLFCFQTMSGIDSTIIETPFGLWNRNLADTLVITSCGFSKNSRDELFCITGFFVSHHIFCITTLWMNCSSKFDPVLRNAMRFASNSKHSSPSESSLLCSKASKIQQASFQGSTECGSIVLVAFPRT